MTAQVTSHVERHIPMRDGYEHDGDRDKLLEGNDRIQGQLWERIRIHAFNEMIRRLIDANREILDRLK